MSKRKLDPSTLSRNFSIRSCIKDPRVKRVFFVGSDSEATESNQKGGFGIRPREAVDKDPITDVGIKDTSGDCEKEKCSNLIGNLEQDSIFSGGTRKTGYLPKGILKKPNGTESNRDDPIQRTPPEDVVADNAGAPNNCHNTFTRSRARAATCSRQKLVQVPGSVSYRRLLPYLMEMDKDEAQVSPKEQSFTPNMDSLNSITSENNDTAEILVHKCSSLEKPEYSTTSILVSTVAQSSEVTTAENIQSNSTYAAVQPQQSSEIPKAESTQCNSTNLTAEAQQSSENPTAENTPSNKIFFSVGQSSELPIEENILQQLSEIPAAESTQSDSTYFTAEPQHSSEIPTKENIQSDTTYFTVEPQQTSEIPTAENIQSTSNNFTVKPQQSELPTLENIQSNSTNLIVEPQPPSDSSIQEMEVLCISQLVPFPSSVQGTLTIDELASENVHNVSEVCTSPKMGEIKRDNTGGCKGICMCLDCVLFRTHAERAFVFSKKQLSEADGIIRGLVTEICSLRHILEKCIGNKCSDCSQVYQDELVKVSCEKASLAEKLATMHMQQMFMDLDAHSKHQDSRLASSDCASRKPSLD